MKIITLIGTRQQLIKVAVISKIIKKQKWIKN